MDLQGRESYGLSHKRWQPQASLPNFLPSFLVSKKRKRKLETVISFCSLLLTHPKPKKYPPVFFCSPLLLFFVKKSPPPSALGLFGLSDLPAPLRVLSFLSFLFSSPCKLTTLLLLRDSPSLHLMKEVTWSMAWSWHERG